MHTIKRICAVAFVMGLFALTFWVCDLQLYTEGPSGGQLQTFALWISFLGSGFVTWITTQPASKDRP